MDKLQQMWQALHSLHEQAHGAIPFRTCTVDPCRYLGVDKSRSHLRDPGIPTGPAALSLPLHGSNH